MTFTITGTITRCAGLNHYQVPVELGSGLTGTLHVLKSELEERATGGSDRHVRADAGSDGVGGQRSKRDNVFPVARGTGNEDIQTVKG